jgi:hypothetical protein
MYGEGVTLGRKRCSMRPGAWEINKTFNDYLVLLMLIEVCKLITNFNALINIYS